MRNFNPLTLVAVAAIIILGLFFAYIYAQVDTTTITITSKESVAKGSNGEGNGGGHEYRVYTDDETYKIGDSWIHPRFDSANLYGKLREGQTYKCEKYGIRFGLTSSFENLLECKPVGR